MTDHPILDRIDDPRQLAGLSYLELKQLAGEIRQTLLETVAETGGHVSSNLGVVELTIALHRVFESPRDRIVWDVGHQGYVHKLLTGRRDRFHTLRQLGGISGFLVREESAHDAFGAGHAGKHQGHRAQPSKHEANMTRKAPRQKGETGGRGYRLRDPSSASL